MFSRVCNWKDVLSSEWKLLLSELKERAGLLPSLLQKALPLPCVYGPCVSQGYVRSVSHPTEQHKPRPFEKLACSVFLWSVEYALKWIPDF